MSFLNESLPSVGKRGIIRQTPSNAFQFRVFTFSISVEVIRGPECHFLHTRGNHIGSRRIRN